LARGCGLRLIDGAPEELERRDDGWMDWVRGRNCDPPVGIDRNPAMPIGGFVLAIG